MKTIQLSKRLKEAAKFVKENELLADIGSDHAYLPIYLIQNNKIPFAVAGEVVEGPYENARQKVQEIQLENKIDVRLGDGLNVINKSENIGTISICGMGGLLICDILHEGLAKDLVRPITRLVLQPNNNEYTLRKFLVANGYEIIDEEILEDKHKRYEIIVAEKVDTDYTLTDEELYFGPHLMKNKDDVFIKKWQTERKHYQLILERMKDSKDIQTKKEIEDKLAQIERVLR